MKTRLVGVPGMNGGGERHWKAKESSLCQLSKWDGSSIHKVSNLECHFVNAGHSPLRQRQRVRSLGSRSTSCRYSLLHFHANKDSCIIKPT